MWKKCQIIRNKYGNIKFPQMCIRDSVYRLSRVKEFVKNRMNETDGTLSHRYKRVNENDKAGIYYKHLSNEKWICLQEKERQRWKERWVTERWKITVENDERLSGTCMFVPWWITQRAWESFLSKFPRAAEGGETFLYSSA